MIKNSIIPSTLSKDQGNYAYITKEYPLMKIRRVTKVKKKIRYNNPDDFDKVLSIASSDPILSLKKNQIKIAYKNSKYIKFSLYMPNTLAMYKPKIYVKNLRNDEMEEILQLNIEVIGDNEEE